MGSRECRVVPWADLPTEILATVGKRLATHTDVLRFRSVCKSWRTSTPPFPKPPPLKLPYPIDPTADGGRHPIDRLAHFNLVESTVYLLNDSSSSPNGWLIKLQPSNGPQLRVVNPLSDRPIKHQPPQSLPEVLNLLNIRVSELCKAYNLEYVNPLSPPTPNCIRRYARKIVLSSNRPKNEYAVMAIDNRGQLCTIKSGDKTWTILYKDYYGYVDVIEFNGMLCAVDNMGKTILFDLSLNQTEISNRVYNGGTKKHLVESCGELFLVDVIRDTDRKTYSYDENEECYYEKERRPSFYTALEIKVYKLNEKKHEWESVKSLEDRVLFVGDDCSFFVSALEYTGCTGNCIYYTDMNYFLRFEVKNYVRYEYDEYDDQTDEDDEGIDQSDELRALHGHNTGVCDFKDGRLGPLTSFREYASIFWPPPSWLRLDEGSSGC